MLPGEEQIIAVLKAANRPLFTCATELITLANKVIVEIQKRPRPTADEYLIDTTSVMILCEAVRRFRSIIALLEIGQGENADILARSLFETHLAIHFVLDDLKSHRKDIPLPSGVNAKAFRALLYFAGQPLAYQRIKEKSAIPYGMSQAASPGSFDWLIAELNNDLGHVAADRIRSTRRYCGLSVKQLAERHGCLSYYDSVYGLQCGISHGASAFDQLRMDFISGGIVLSLMPPSASQTAVVLKLAAAMILAMLMMVDVSYQLQKKDVIEEMAAIFGEIRLPG